MNNKYGIGDIDSLVSDREKFEEYVYTPVDDAIRLLKERRGDSELTKKIEGVLGNDIPEPLKDFSQIRAVIFRQITTPNYEIRRFVHIVDALNELKPLFAEYQDDKFTSNNDYKHSWGKILFHKKHGAPLDSLTVIDLVKSDGKKISEIKTIWDEPIVDFHHRLLGCTHIPTSEDFFLNISKWLRDHGGRAKDYYVPIMFWFIQNAILFENFTPGGSKESLFTREVFLPAFIKTYEMVGLKPLIVNLLPTNIENEKFWLSHPFATKTYIQNQIDGTK